MNVWSLGSIWVCFFAPNPLYSNISRQFPIFLEKMVGVLVASLAWPIGCHVQPMMALVGQGSRWLAMLGLPSHGQPRQAMRGQGRLLANLAYWRHWAMTGELGELGELGEQAIGELGELCAYWRHDRPREALLGLLGAMFSQCWPWLVKVHGGWPCLASPAMASRGWPHHGRP